MFWFHVASCRGSVRPGWARRMPELLGPRHVDDLVGSRWVFLSRAPSGFAIAMLRCVMHMTHGWTDQSPRPSLVEVEEPGAAGLPPRGLDVLRDRGRADVPRPPADHQELGAHPRDDHGELPALSIERAVHARDELRRRDLLL